MIKAGVSARPIAVEINKASNGESVSLTPRSNCVKRMNVNSTGMSNIIMRA
ncbi:MAG: hypothetical protein R3E42_16950 [Burkholderiaceae bacterium]